MDLRTSQEANDWMSKTQKDRRNGGKQGTGGQAAPGPVGSSWDPESELRSNMIRLSFLRPSGCLAENRLQGT